LETIKVPSYPKTSGNTGIHICVPLGANYSYEQAKQFTEIVMHYVHSQLPEITSVERSPDKRKGKIYLDFLQNRKGQTMAAPYCVRPVPGAQVSTPLAWDEVDDSLDPADFTIQTIPERLADVGDLWKPVLGRGVNLKRALAALEKLGD
jgi:bifunctional non-homologous end joining protein LigD